MYSQIMEIINAADAMKNSYFMRAPGNASARRAMEKRYRIPRVAWTDGGHDYTAEFDVTCSCSNIYAHGTYTRDGRKTTLTAIRNSAARLAVQQPAQQPIACAM